jgi:hypothetical protein
LNEYDFWWFWHGLERFINGGSPYNGFAYFWPMPLTVIFAPLALIPISIAFPLWLAFNALLLWLILRWKAIKWLAFLPMIYLFSSGQIILPFWAMAYKMERGKWAAAMAAFITLEPQLAFILLPFHLWRWLRQDRSTLYYWLLFTALLWGIPSLIWPQFTAEWVKTIVSGDAGHGTQTAPGLWSLTWSFPQLLPVLAIVSLALGIWGIRQREEIVRSVMALIVPVGFFYDTLMLMETAPALWLTIAGLIGIAGMALLANPAPSIIISATPLVYHLYQKNRAESRKEKLGALATPQPVPPDPAPVLGQSGDAP